MYCTHCGADVSEEHRYCAACGRPQAPAINAAALPRPRVESHLKLVGILWIAYAGLHVLAAFGALLAANVILPAVLSGVGLPFNSQFIPALVGIVGWGLLIASAFGIVTGWSLLERAPWARVAAIVLAFLALLNFPFGTAIGVYTLWALLPEAAAREYERLARAA